MQHFDREHKSGRTNIFSETCLPRVDSTVRRPAAQTVIRAKNHELPKMGCRSGSRRVGSERRWRVQAHEKLAIQLELGVSDLEASMPFARCSSTEGGIVKEMQSADSEHPFYDPLEEVVGAAEGFEDLVRHSRVQCGAVSRPWRAPRGNLVRGLQFFQKKKKRKAREEERERPNCLHPRWTQPCKSSHVDTDQCTRAKATHLTEVCNKTFIRVYVMAWLCASCRLRFQSLVLDAVFFFPASNCQRDVCCGPFFIASAGSHFEQSLNSEFFSCPEWEEGQWL